MNPIVNEVENLAGGFWAEFQVYILIAVVALLFGAGGMYKIMSDRHDKYVLDEKLAAAKIKGEQKVTTAQIETKYVDRVEKIYVQGKTITKEVPVYVTARDDSNCTINNGFVRLHDAAVSGIPATPGNADEAPSSIKLSDVENTVTDNYTACRTNAERFVGLQEWVRAQAKVTKSHHLNAE